MLAAVLVFGAQALSTTNVGTFSEANTIATLKVQLDRLQRSLESTLAENSKLTAEMSKLAAVKTELAAANSELIARKAAALPARRALFASLPEPVCPWQPTVSVITHALNETASFWGTWKAGAELAAQDSAVLEWRPVGFNEALAADSISAACNSSDALVVTIPYANGTAEYTTIDAAIKACTPRLPVVTTNTDTYHNEDVYLYVGSSNVAIGQRCGLAVLGEPLDVVLGRKLPGEVNAAGLHFGVYWGGIEKLNQGIQERLDGLNATLAFYGATLQVFHQPANGSGSYYFERMITLSSSWLNNSLTYVSDKSDLYICGDEDINNLDVDQFGQSPFLQGQVAVSTAMNAAKSAKYDVPWLAIKGNIHAMSPQESAQNNCPGSSELPSGRECRSDCTCKSGKCENKICN